MAKPQIPPLGIIGKTLAGYIVTKGSGPYYELHLLFTDGTAIELYSDGDVYFLKELRTNAIYGFKNLMHGRDVLAQEFMEGVEPKWHDEMYGVEQ